MTRAQCMKKLSGLVRPYRVLTPYGAGCFAFALSNNYRKHMNQLKSLRNQGRK